MSEATSVDTKKYMIGSEGNYDYRIVARTKDGIGLGVKGPIRAGTLIKGYYGIMFKIRSAYLPDAEEDGNVVAFKAASEDRLWTAWPNMEFTNKGAERSSGTIVKLFNSKDEEALQAMVSDIQSGVLAKEVTEFIVGIIPEDATPVDLPEFGAAIQHVLSEDALPALQALIERRKLETTKLPGVMSLGTQKKVMRSIFDATKASKPIPGEVGEDDDNEGEQD